MIREYSYSRDFNLNISPHFKVKEFKNPIYDDKVLIDDELVQILEKIRADVNKGIIITLNGGYRTTEQNIKIGGATNSYHLKGQAVDIYVKGMSPTDVALYAVKNGASGIGIYNTFTHIDTRPNFYIFKS